MSEHTSWRDVNTAILDILGIDYKGQSIHSVDISLQVAHEPVIVIRRFLRDEAGKRYIVDQGQVAEITERFKLVPLEDDE